MSPYCIPPHYLDLVVDRRPPTPPHLRDVARRRRTFGRGRSGR